MVAVTSGKILVTGASGYVGAWIVRYLVDQGFTVSVAVRNASQGNFIVNRFPEYKGKVSHILVPDITTDGAYDEAVKDVVGIIHAASPVVWKWEDPSEIIDPAVKGAIGILNSADRFGSQVQRVILTSSVVAIASAGAPGVVYDEAIWNTSSEDHVKQNGKQSNPWQVYNASKTLAEQAAWNWVKENNPKFDFASVLPVYNYGPYIHEVPNKDKLGSTPAMFLGTFASPDTSGDAVGDWVDVRDDALIHVLALKTPVAGGQRIIAGGGSFAWQDLYDVLNDAGYPNVPGRETKGTGKASGSIYSNATSLKVFPGLKYRTLEESVQDMGADFEKSGFF